MPNQLEALPPSLNDGEAVNRRFKSARDAKTPWETTYREAMEYALPQRELFYYHYPGEHKTVQVFDSTAIDSTQRFAAKMQAWATPPGRHYVEFVPGTDILEPYDQDFMNMLASATDTFFKFKNIPDSNFWSATHEVYLELAIGQGTLLIEDIGPPRFLGYRSIPLSHVLVEQGPTGLAETVFVLREMEGRSVLRQWPDAKWPEGYEQTFTDGPDKKHPIVEMRSPTIEAKTGKITGYWTVVFVQKAPNTIAWAQFEGRNNPCVTPRWMKNPTERYGRGPVLACLPDIRTVNKVREFNLRAAAFQVAPPLMADSDSAINPFTFVVQPGTIIPVQQNDVRKPAIMPVDIGGNLNTAMLLEADLQRKIRRALLDEEHTAGEGPVESATKVARDNLSLQENQGAQFGRIMTEMVGPSVAREVEILQKHGKMPRANQGFVLDGRTVGIKHTSPLARQQDAYELMALEQAQGFMNMLVPPELQMIGLKKEDMAEWVWRKVGADPRLIRDKTQQDQMKAMVQQMAVAMAEQMVEQGKQPGAGNGQA